MNCHIWPCLPPLHIFSGEYFVLQFLCCVSPDVVKEAMTAAMHHTLIWHTHTPTRMPTHAYTLHWEPLFNACERVLVCLGWAMWESVFCDLSSSLDIGSCSPPLPPHPPLSDLIHFVSLPTVISSKLENKLYTILKDVSVYIFYGIYIYCHHKTASAWFSQLSQQYPSGS